MKKTTRRVLKPWLEKLLVGILIFNFMFIASINDFSSLLGMVITYGTLIMTSWIIIKVLGKHGSKELLNVVNNNENN